VQKVLQEAAYDSKQKVEYIFEEVTNTIKESADIRRLFNRKILNILIEKDKDEYANVFSTYE
jgi:translation initiation factor 2 beta subunit (eIF-2beta)/eIF-5